MSTHPESVRERVQELAATGLGSRPIARQLGIPRTTVYRWLHPDYAAAQRIGSTQAKQRRTGVCSQCGGETRYNGHTRNGPSDICNPCSLAKQKAERKWTREAVIAAIQRFAAEHGRPPKATEWSTADRSPDYPAASTVYSRHRNYHPPFASWADAIEAAGFPRPRRGHYQRTKAAA